MPTSPARSPISRHRVSNLESGLDVLELLRDHPRGLSLSEVARRLNLSKNLAFRVSSTLLEREFLVRDEESMRLMLGRKLLTMGYAAEAEVGLVETALPTMRRLRDEFNETVTLCVLLEDEGIVLEAIPSSHHFRFVVETGMRFPLHASASGKAILAHCGFEEAMRRASLRGLKRFTKHTLTTKSAFAKELGRVRQQGYAVDAQESYDGTHCVAAPIRDGAEDVIVALNITGPSYRFPGEVPFDRIGPHVAELAQCITDDLHC